MFSFIMKTVYKLKRRNFKLILFLFLTILLLVNNLLFFGFGVCFRFFFVGLGFFVAVGLGFVCLFLDKP